MTTPELTQLITAIGAIVTPIMVAAFGVVQHRSSSRNHEQGKEILKAANGTLMAQSEVAAVATQALAAAIPTEANVAKASDAAAILQSRKDGKAAQ